MKTEIKRYYEWQWRPKGTKAWRCEMRDFRPVSKKEALEQRKAFPHLEYREMHVTERKTIHRRNTGA